MPSYVAAHTSSFANRKEVERSDRCGCFHCQRIYDPAIICEWIEDSGVDETAVCPCCGKDTVIGSASGHPVTHEFLQQMHDFWFETIHQEDVARDS